MLQGNDIKHEMQLNGMKWTNITADYATTKLQTLVTCSPYPHVSSFRFFHLWAPLPETPMFENDCPSWGCLPSQILFWKRLIYFPCQEHSIQASAYYPDHRVHCLCTTLWHWLIWTTEDRRENWREPNFIARLYCAVIWLACRIQVFLVSPSTNSSSNNSAELMYMT